MIIAGIDYSLTSPAICVHVGEIWDIKNCIFYYLVNSEKKLVVSDQFKGMLYEPYNSDTERYDNLSKWSSVITTRNNVVSCYIEGYAYNAVGRVFQIAENTGLLKYSLWKNDIPYDVFAPPAIKKFATGKGTSNKEAMYVSFLAETGLDIREKLNITSLKQWNPLSDIVDSYYICKMGHEKRIDNQL
jgi:Holliday junction resolvasome RuvABC endonuclease subunit